MDLTTDLTGMKIEAEARSQVKDNIMGREDDNKFPWNPDRSNFPSRKDLPKIPGAPDGAAWVWGADDNLGRLNLLTPKRVLEASKEIRTGEIIPINLPLHEPDPPSFGRETFQHEIKTIAKGISYDDLYHLNTQSGTQWDGFRHFSHIPTRLFYNATNSSSITTDSPKLSIHHWADHGIVGRFVLLDYYTFAQLSPERTYDPYSQHSITFADLVACGKHQGLDIRPRSEGGDVKPGDILLIRSGFVSASRAKPLAERTRLAHREGNDLVFAGVEQSEDMVTWLHDCWFSAVGGDAPSFEVWPRKEKYFLHEYLLALWGVPIGEMLDLERLGVRCREEGRWTGFLTSAVANVHGGVSSHVNGQVIF